MKPQIIHYRWLTAEEIVSTSSLNTKNLVDNRLPSNTHSTQPIRASWLQIKSLYCRVVVYSPRWTSGTSPSSPRLMEPPASPRTCSGWGSVPGSPRNPSDAPRTRVHHSCEQRQQFYTPADTDSCRQSTVSCTTSIQIAWVWTKWEILKANLDSLSCGTKSKILKLPLS